MFLNNEQVTEEIKREIKNFLETNDNENTTQNLWDTGKAVLRGKFIAVQSYLKKQTKKNRLDNLTTLKTTGKRTTTKLKISRINHKDPSRNKWKRNERNNNKD